MSDATTALRLGPQQARIYLSLRTAIEQGQLRPGSTLDSQAELARRYGVALATLHHALRALERDGFVVRRQGVGTFVADAPPTPLSPLRALARLTTQLFPATRDAADAALRLLAEHIGVHSAFLSRIEDDRLTVVADYDYEGCGIRAGAQFPLSDAF